MKIAKLGLLIYTYLLVSCNNDTKQQPDALPVPKAGIVVITDSVDIAEDKLNNLKFSVAVLTNDNTISGSYNVAIAFGHNTALTVIKMPHKCENAKPALRKADKPYSYVIGFYLEGDTVFHDYYEVIGGNEQIRAGYIRSYTFE